MRDDMIKNIVTEALKTRSDSFLKDHNPVPYPTTEGITSLPSINQVLDEKSF